MSTGYTPLFSSLTTGTLCGRWPDIGLWPIVLSLADRYGVVDVTPDYLAKVTGLSLEDVVACMARFCAPDPYSRTPDEGGARLVLLEPDSRSWGWRVVNHTKYREKARKAAFDATRTEDGRNAERMSARRQVKTSSGGADRADPASSRDDPMGPAITRDHPRSPALRGKPKPKPDQKKHVEPEPPGNAPALHVDSRETLSEPEIFEAVETIKAKYPDGAGREDWITAEKHMRQLVINGEATWTQLEEGVSRYQRICRATDRIVMNPANFFGAVDKPWSQKWPLPKTRAERAQDSNIEAGQAWLEESSHAT